MSQNLHQFFQITDMISRLERQFFLPRYIIKHLVHTLFLHKARHQTFRQPADL